MAKDIFISYSTADRDHAEKICRLLEDRGLTCWIAPRDVRPGKNYGEEITDGIAESLGLVLVLSEHANESPYVRREVERAVSKGKNIFPVRIREVIPSKALEFFVAETQWIDAWKPPLETKVDQLAAAVHELKGGSSGVPRPEALGRVTSKGSRSGAKHGVAITVAAIIAAVVVGLLLLRDGGQGEQVKRPEPASRNSSSSTQQAGETPSRGDAAKRATENDARRRPTLPRGTAPRPPGPPDDGEMKGIEIVAKSTSAAVAAPLKLAYGAKQPGGTPRAAVQVWVSRGKAWKQLDPGEEMSSADRYKIIFQPATPLYFYVFQIDSTGKLDWLFPRNDSPYSFGSNPVPARAWTQLPEGANAFHLDGNLGVEHVYVVAQGTRWRALEASLERACKSGSSGTPITASFALKTRGVGGVTHAEHFVPPASVSPPDTPADTVTEIIEGTKGVLVYEMWFRHIASPTASATRQKHGTVRRRGALPLEGRCAASTGHVRPARSRWGPAASLAGRI